MDRRWHPRAAGEPAVYYYRHATAGDPDTPTVEGVVARVLLEPWGDGVRPHEHTMPGPKADRLALLRSHERAAEPDPRRSTSTAPSATTTS